MMEDGTDPKAAPARYVFRVTFRLDPKQGVTTEPDRFETVLYRAADPPGEDGWLFFRDNCWRGNVADERHVRQLAEDALGVPVESVSFSELQTSEAYLDDLKEAIAADLGVFNADDVTEVLSKYLGSSIRVE
ncbi:LWR-salt protein [Halomicroarcula limicola]|uniref:LWR-salt protein n=1 Tax=Haloarcula limicola TaxID=1429915 RepID=A0A8J7YCF2_9EURY|nr:LWR-salt protein [Halomicroarcula limicola]MBV0924696.1 LWR-salt protein [Halomicroarcula limicola]